MQNSGNPTNPPITPEIAANRESVLAKRLFAAISHQSAMEDEFGDAALKVFGVAPDDFDAWPFSDYHFDHYDSSFELDGCRNGLELSPEQRAAFWAMGFYRCWLNFADGTERPYWNSDVCPESQGELRRKAGVRSRVVPKDDAEGTQGLSGEAWTGEQAVRAFFRRLFCGHIWFFDATTNFTVEGCFKCGKRRRR